MTRCRSITLLAAFTASISTTPLSAQPPGGMMAGGMMGGGMMSGTRDTADMAMMRLVHEMMVNHDKLRRTVTNLPNGIRTVTESDDPALRQVLRQHVGTTGEMVRTARDANLPMVSPSLHGVLRNGTKITRSVELTASGVVVVETSADPATVALLQAHAAEVTELVKRGMAAMHEMMMKNGGMHGDAPAAPAAPASPAAASKHVMPAGANHAMPDGMNHGNSDSAYAAVQARGKVAMGIDQYTSTHHFEAMPDGGRIELQRDVDDPAGIATIRTHLQDISKAFSSGDFTTPAYVHMQSVPGASVMAARRALITYTFKALPRGGELRISTSDPEAVAAIAQFMAFQRMDHRAH